MTRPLRWPLAACLLSFCLLQPAAAQVDGGRLPTRWDRDVSPDHPLPEYPRPQLARTRWANLNGPWDYALTDPAAAAPPAAYAGRIRVPFPYESALSGVGRPSPVDRTLWCRRTFAVPAGWRTDGQRTLLHFGAVNYHADVWVNGHRVATHTGGFDGFDADVTDALHPDGDNELIVAVRNPVAADSPAGQIVGKQRAHPGGVLYTAATGIWQTVWIEPVPAVHVAGLTIVPDVAHAAVRVTVDAGGAAVRVTALDGGTPMATVDGTANTALVIPVPDAHLWTPADPHLYGLHITLAGGDAVDSYFAMRSVSVAPDAHGVPRIHLNGRADFAVGALDQGYWPDGLFTAPTDAALRSDIDAAKRLGFTLLRKHAKVEPDRWYYWADTLGILVWQDVPQAFGDHLTDPAKRQWEAEMRALIAGRGNHPCIVVWTPFNEGWGEHDTASIAALAHELDPSRLVDAASGGYAQPVDGVMTAYRLPTPPGIGDVNDVHTYPDPTIEPADPARARACGEFGGVSMRVPGHDWSAANFGYGAVVPDGWHLTARYQQLLREAYGLRDAGASAVVYTQLVDVEDETNGLLTYDRAVLKPLPDLIAAANAGRFPPMRPPPPDRALVPTSADAPQPWRYTTDRPAGDWASPSFDAAGWRTGPAPFGHGYAAGTDWHSADVWLRRTVTLPATLPDRLTLAVLHDEAADVYLNGVPAAHLDGYAGDYVPVAVAASARAAVKAGRPAVIAVHCHNTTGGQVIDVGIAAP